MHLIFHILRCSIDTLKFEMSKFRSRLCSIRLCLWKEVDHIKFYFTSSEKLLQSMIFFVINQDVQLYVTKVCYLHSLINDSFDSIVLLYWTTCGCASWLSLHVSNCLELNIDNLIYFALDLSNIEFSHKTSRNWSFNISRCEWILQYVLINLC